MTPAASECSQLLDKTLDAFEKLQITKSGVDAELTTNKDLRVKEEAYNAELLKAVALLVSSEKRTKSFFEKLVNQLERILKSATDPKTLATIVSLIILSKQLRR